MEGKSTHSTMNRNIQPRLLLGVKSMGTFPVQRGRRCGGVRHTATAAGRAFGPSSLCYMTKDPLSPGFFLNVPSQPQSLPRQPAASGPRQVPGMLPASWPRSPQSTPSQLFKGAQSTTELAQTTSSVLAPAGARHAARQLAQIPRKVPMTTI